jgi:predicted component of type VI protein secretion system
MDGKNGAEELISKLLADYDLLKSLAAKAKEAPTTSETATPNETFDNSDAQ